MAEGGARCLPARQCAHLDSDRPRDATGYSRPYLLDVAIRIAPSMAEGGARCLPARQCAHLDSDRPRDATGYSRPYLLDVAAG
jgi:hypothetical protein